MIIVGTSNSLKIYSVLRIKPQHVMFSLSVLGLNLKVLTMLGLKHALTLSYIPSWM